MPAPSSQEVEASRSLRSRARPVLHPTFWRDHWPHAVAVLLAVVVVVPLVVLGVDGFGRRWFPAGDWAMTELRVLDTGTADTPLVGPYSRFGWNHPGPLLFWLYAGPYRVLGSGSSALVLIASLVNAAAVAGTVWFAWRRGRLPLVAMTVAALSLVLASFDEYQLRDPWNPWVTVLPFGLLLMAAWSAVERDRAGLLVAVAVGSLVVQSHVGYVPLVGGLLLWAFVWYWRRGGDRRTFGWALLVLGLCWLPVLVDVITGGDNVGRLLQHFTSGRETAGFTAGLEMAARQLGHEAPWMGGEEPIDAFGGALLGRSPHALALPVLLAALACAGAALRRRYDAVRFQATMAFVVVLAVFTVSRISDEIFDYLVRWWWPVAALWWVAAAWSVWSALLSLAPRARPFVRPLAAVAAAALAVVLMVDVVDARHSARMPVDDWYATLDAIADVSVDEVRREGDTVMLRSSGPLAGWLEDALSVQLVKAGVDVVVPDGGINRQKFGDHRIDDGSGRATTAIWVVTGPDVAVAAARPGWRPIAVFDPLDPERRGTAEQLDAYLVERFAEAGRTDEAHAVEEGLPVAFLEGIPGVTQEHLRLRDQLRAEGVRVAVFLTGATDELYGPSGDQSK